MFSDQRGKKKIKKFYSAKLPRHQAAKGEKINEIVNKLTMIN